MRHTRLDSSPLNKPTRLPNGFLRADAYFTRTGVFTYRVDTAGSLRREYRPADEVFHADSLATLGLVPVTDDHPPGLIDADNATKYARGTVGEQPRRDGDKIAGSILVTDAGLIEKMEKGDAQQVSMGYTCDLEFRSGVSATGEHFDAVQKNIRYNHLAVLPRGRAGPEVRVRMDAENLGVILNSAAEPEPPTKEQAVFKIRIDGVDFEVPSEQTSQAFARQQKLHADALELAKKEAGDASKRVEQLQAKADAAQAEVDQLKKDAAEAPKKLREEMAARSLLEGKAREVLGSKAKLDGLTDAEVRSMVLGKLLPDVKLDGKSAVYLEARFDSEIERLEKSDAGNPFAKKKKSEKAKEEDEEEDEEDDDDEKKKDRLDADDARKAMIKNNRDMWKKPAGARLSDDHNVTMR